MPVHINIKAYTEKLKFQLFPGQCTVQRYWGAAKTLAGQLALVNVVLPSSLQLTHNK
jgi:hypothetical protein